jgi:hypothetical protein
VKLYFYILFFLSLSCQNGDEEVVTDLLKSNDQLLTEHSYNLRDEYEERKREYNYLNKSRIEVWQKKGEKIDSLYKILYENTSFLSKDFNTILKLDKETNDTVLTIIYSKIDNKFTTEQIERDKANFLKYNNQKLFKIVNSNYSDSTKNQLYQNYFRNKSLDFQNYCNALAPRIMRCLTYLKYSHLASVDKNILLPGQKLVAQVGVGEITRNSSPKFYINNKFIESDIDGIARLTLKANSKKGKYKIPIKIIEQSEDGNLVTHTRELEYEVVDTLCKQ